MGRKGMAARANLAVAIVSIPLFACLWELVSDSGVVNPVLFPPPIRSPYI